MFLNFNMNNLGIILSHAAVNWHFSFFLYVRMGTKGKANSTELPEIIICDLTLSIKLHHSLLCSTGKIRDSKKGAQKRHHRERGNPRLSKRWQLYIFLIMHCSPKSLRK